MEIIVCEMAAILAKGDELKPHYPCLHIIPLMVLSALLDNAWLNAIISF